MSEDKITDSMRVAGRHVSMDAPIAGGEEGYTLIDTLKNQDSLNPDLFLMRESLHEEILRSLSTLTDRESNIVKLFYGIGQTHGLTLEEIGAKYDITRERVRQIKEKAIRRMKHKTRSKLLRPFLATLG